MDVVEGKPESKSKEADRIVAVLVEIVASL
jgi:hypothetical protein